MSPIKTLARESYFLASIFSKTVFLFSKIGGQPFNTFFNHKKKLSLVSSKAENLFSNIFSKKPFVLEL